MKRMSGWANGRMVLSCVALLSAHPLIRLSAQDPLIQAAERMAAAWQQRRFTDILAPGTDVIIVLPASGRSAPLAPAQAAEVLRAFTEGARNEEVRVSLVRTIGEGRAYVELDRQFSPRGTPDRSRHTIYLELRNNRVVEIRVVS